MDFDDLSKRVIGCAIEAHRFLGPGLLESTYEECLCRELELATIPHERQVPIAIEYKGKLVECAYRIDVLVAGTLAVELKSVEKLADIHEAQLLTYLKFSRLPLGLLFNFNVLRLNAGGLKRFVR